MARLESREYVYFTTVRGVCARCAGAVPARVFFRDGGVWQQRLCPHSSAPAQIAGDEAWYLCETLKAFPMKPPLPNAGQPRRGCPNDCGPCTWHAGGCESVELLSSNVEDARCAIEWLAAKWGSLDSIAILTRNRTVAAELPGQVILKAAICDRDLPYGTRITLEASLAEAGEALARISEFTDLTFCAGDVPVDELARRVCSASGGGLTLAGFLPEPPAHPLCRLRAEFRGRPVRVHSYMNTATFDCARVMLCPEWKLARPGTLVPGCVNHLSQED
jgi:hypothetical protein